MDRTAEAPKTAVQEGQAPRNKGTFTPARNTMFSLTLATFGNYGLLSAGLLLVLTMKIRVGAVGHFLILAMGIAAIPLVTACNFYIKDAQKRFAARGWKWYSAVVGVLTMMLAFRILGVSGVLLAARGIAALGLLWIACAILLPLPQFVERIHAKDWKSIAAALWCVAVMGLLLTWMIFQSGLLPASEAVLAAGAGLWFTGYLARAYWYSRLEGIAFRKAFHFFCWPLWIGAVLIYGFNLWVALPMYEGRIAPAREAAAKTFGHPIDRKAWEALYYSTGTKADELIKTYQEQMASAPFQKTYFEQTSLVAAPDLTRENGALLREELQKNELVAAMLKLDEAVLAKLPIRETLLPHRTLLFQQQDRLGVMRTVCRHQLLLGRLALRAKDVPAALANLVALKKLACAAASEPIFLSQQNAVFFGKTFLTLAEESLKTEGFTSVQKQAIAKAANRLVLTLAKSLRAGGYGEAVSFDEAMTALRNDPNLQDLPRIFSMRYTLPQFAVVAAKGHGQTLHDFSLFPSCPKRHPSEFMRNWLVADPTPVRDALIDLGKRAKALK